MHFDLLHFATSIKFCAEQKLRICSQGNFSSLSSLLGHAVGIEEIVMRKKLQSEYLMRSF
jgi:hypothetical protein